MKTIRKQIKCLYYNRIVEMSMKGLNNVNSKLTLLTLLLNKYYNKLLIFSD